MSLFLIVLQRRYIHRFWGISTNNADLAQSISKIMQPIRTKIIQLSAKLT